MQEELAIKILKKIGVESFLSSEELDIARYNLTIIIINIEKMFIVYGMAFVANTITVTLCMHIAFSSLRRYAGGWHATTSRGCSLISIFIFVIVPKLALEIVKTSYAFNSLFYYSVIWLLLLSILQFAPADTEKNLVVGFKLRKSRQIKAIIVFCSLITVSFFLPSSYQFAIFLGVLLECLTIHPLYYAMFKRSYNNYEKYEAHDE
ncbi:accessory gene regulator B family protein [Lactiplantibacillus pentosus]|uniref:accessory gene regulator B family protein n=1 Tax=Lactiplantibacillus pentosus TaxID=1589 RepID=UPI0034D63EC9